MRRGGGETGKEQQPRLTSFLPPMHPHTHPHHAHHPQCPRRLGWRYCSCGLKRALLFLGEEGWWVVVVILRFAARRLNYQLSWDLCEKWKKGGFLRYTTSAQRSYAVLHCFVFAGRTRPKYLTEPRSRYRRFGGRGGACFWFYF